ncbi:MAG: Polyprenol monophosphomannose synthase [Anaerolineales bacterium]|nr:Polyprenol monophosphomannose synthase [Anaerolineales bacterium]
MARQAIQTTLLGPAQAPCLVIIPALNEEHTIAEVVQGARSHLPFADILVIDDGSRDNTAAEARRAGAIVLRLPYNLGIGGAVQTGFKFAHRHSYEYVARVDADGQHDPRDLSLLLGAVQHQEADVAIGTRFEHALPDRATSFLRRLGTWGFARLVSFLTGQPASDTTSGLQCLNRSAVECLAAYYPQDYPEVEGRIVLHRAGLRVLEMPVVMHPRNNGRSSITPPRAVYYVVKVLLATLMAMVRETPYVGRGLDAA